MAEIESPELRVIVEDIPNIVLAENGRMGIVLSQPRLVLDKDSNPPFRISTSSRDDVIAYVTQAIAAVNDLNASSRMLIFPEYSVPIEDPNGLKRILEWIGDGPNNTVVIAGLESFAITDLQRLKQLLPSLKSAINVSNPPTEAFLNCCLVLIKDNQGAVLSYIQPKLRPSQWEAERLRMLCGDYVFLFRCQTFNFIILICFDLIGSEANMSLIDELIRKLGNCASRPGDCILLHAVVNLQHNPKPHDEKFIEAGTKFLRPRPELNMSNGLAIFANTASSKECYHGLFGRTSLLFGAGRWKFPENEPALYSTHMPNEDLQVFEFRRKIGGIFSFECLLPVINTRQSGDPRIPIATGRFWLRETSSSSWIPEVTEALPRKLALYLCVSTEPDCEAEFRVRLRCDSVNLQETISSSYETIRSSLLGLTKARSREILRLLFCDDEMKEVAEKSDTWKVGDEGEAVRELARSLTILSLLSALLLEGGPIVTARHEIGLFAIIDGANIHGIHRAVTIYDNYQKNFPLLSPSPGQKIVLIANRFEGEPTLEDRSPPVNRPANPVGLGLRTEPLQPMVNLISAGALHRALGFATVEEAVEHVRRCLD